MATIQDFRLAFGKHKGSMFSQTPESYQKWLLEQTWFKIPSQEARYDVVRKFVSEYVRGMGIKYERVLTNLSWEEANEYKNSMNIYELDDVTEYFYVETSKL